MSPGRDPTGPKDDRTTIGYVGCPPQIRWGSWSPKAPGGVLPALSAWYPPGVKYLFYPTYHLLLAIFLRGRLPLSALTTGFSPPSHTASHRANLSLGFGYFLKRFLSSWIG